MSSAVGIEKGMTLTLGANEDTQVAEALSRVLADTFTLYLKTPIFTGTSLGQCFIRYT